MVNGAVGLFWRSSSGMPFLVASGARAAQRRWVVSLVRIARGTKHSFDAGPGALVFEQVAFSQKTSNDPE